MEAIILFDSDCFVCNSSVQFIIKRDPHGYFHFSSLQGNYGKALLKKANIHPNINSMILYEADDKVYIKSTAALRICKNLQGFWKHFYFLIVIPKPIRDFFYDIIAKNRYKWFGKSTACQIPSPDILKRFLS